MTELRCNGCGQLFTARVLSDGQITLVCDDCLFYEPKLQVVSA